MNNDRFRKPLPENTERMENRLGDIGGRLAELHDLKGMEDSAWWRTRTKKLNEKLAVVESVLFDFEKLTDRTILLYLAEWKLLRTELMTPGDIELEIARLEKELSETTASIDERKKRQTVTA